ncbi:MAG: TIGR03617 family F420-dependent LLM class oxidoreductase [Acidimicrobiales bacterium]
MRVHLMSFGMPLRRAQALAAEAERAGFDGVVVTEGGRSAYLTLGAMALATERLALATGIAVAFPRSPMVSAQLAWELADSSGGRFRLGLGTQVEAHIRRRYDSPFDRPGPRLRDYVQAVRACFAAFAGDAPLAYDGEFYRLNLLPPMWSPGPIDSPAPAIDVAAVNPWMLRMAGEVADGVHVHPLNHPAYLREVVVPEIAEGARRAGRHPNEVELTVPVFTAAGDTEQERAPWRELARAQVAFYGSTPNYAFIFDLLGRPGTTEELRRHQKSGDLKAMTAVIDDELLSAFVVEGAWEELPALLAERYQGVAARVVLYMAGMTWGRPGHDFERFGALAARMGAPGPSD